VEQSEASSLKSPEAFDSLLNSIYTALATYSNVHRGSGQFSQVTTQLYEDAREIVLKYLELDRKDYMIIFSSPLRSESIVKMLPAGCFHILSSEDIGLALGVRALAVRKNALPKGAPVYPGGGSARLVSPDWVVWSKGSEKFEAGTPAIINIIAFARALKMISEYKNIPFAEPCNQPRSAHEILTRDDLTDYKGIELLDRLKESLIGRDVSVPAKNGSRYYINLDNAASTQTFSPVAKAFTMSLQIRENERRVLADEVRSICSDFLDAPASDYEVIFTSNTTESINLAARNLRIKQEGGIIPVVLNTILEHNSNDLPWRDESNSGVIRMNVNDEGFLNLNELEKTLSEYNKDIKHGNARIRLVSVSGASNVLGSCNDIPEISRIVHKFGADLLVDAAQMIAHRKTHIRLCEVDYLAFSAHKAYAPFGTGVLVARRNLLKFSSEELENINSCGEENIAGIAALGKALGLLQRIGMDIICEEEQKHTYHALKALSDINGIKIFGICDPESDSLRNKTGVISFFIKGIWPNQISKELAENGIGVRYGCHCAHMLVKQILSVPPTLRRFQRLLAIAFPGIVFPGVVRISFSLTTTNEEIDAFISVLKEIAAKQKNEKPGMKDKMNEFTRTIAEKVFGA
jgi:selenocysteine lyase/cysteine desulfurase